MIRRMTAADIPAVAALERQYFSVPWSEQSLNESLERPEYLFLIAEQEGEPVGYAGLLRVLDEGDITNIVVDERFRGRGIGYALTEALLAEGARQGICEFTLEVRVSNDRAIRLYEKLGFVREGIRRNFYEKPTEDAWIMWKRSPISSAAQNR